MKSVKKQILLECLSKCEDGSFQITEDGFGDYIDISYNDIYLIYQAMDKYYELVTDLKS